MAEITVQDVRDWLGDFNARCDRARFVGGISHRDVVEAGLGPPPGYWFDHQTHYWIPLSADIERWADDGGREP